MTNESSTRTLPHHRLIAYRVAVELLTAVREARVRDARLREQALKAAKSCCLNCAEAAGRQSRADKARALGIARGECVEAVAAVEIAAAAGDASDQAAARCVALGSRLVALLTGFIG